MMELRRIDPKEILTAGWHDEYEEEKQTIGQELAKLNACVLVLEKVNGFPFHIFAPYREKSHFWDLTSICLFESAVLAIWKIGIDSQSDGLTLRQFRNEILRYLHHEQVRVQLLDALRAVDFEARLSGLEGKIRDLRHNIVAHWNRRWLNGDSEFRSKRAVHVADLKSAAQVLDELYHVLCFGSDFATLPLYYLLDRYNPGRGTDIDGILDDIARKSPALRRPEENPEAWRELKTKLSPEDIGLFNSYRTKLGLETA